MAGGKDASGASGRGDGPIARDAYETLADAYAAIAETKAENGYNEHPAMRRAIADATGLVALDAGCGPGFLVRDLIALGASRVVGVDVSPPNDRNRAADGRARPGTARR